jgi:uncharacterized membrane protein (UPF0127 family)
VNRRCARSLALAGLLTLALAAAPAAGCKSGKEQVGAPAMGRDTAPAASSKLSIDTGERRLVFQVELARTPDEHQRGLMYRQHLAPDAGMLFLFDQEGPQVFWMKNTLIPLDMVFIDHDHRIVGIVADAEPQTLTPRAVPKPSQYVLEIGGGVAAKLGIRPGQRVDFDASVEPH